MKMGKMLVLMLVLILILPSISLIASSREGNTSGISENSIIYKLLKLRFNIGYLEQIPGLGKYFVFQQRPPTPIQSFPASISLNYLNSVTFEIGGRNPSNSSEWQSMVAVAMGWSWAWMDKEIIFHFEFVHPENASEDVWNVQFDPEYLILKPNRNNLDWPGAETPFKTNVTIMLKSNVDPTVVTQDTVLKVNVVKTESLDKFGLLRGAPQFVKTHREEYIQKCEESGEKAWFTGSYVLMYNLIGKYSIFLSNVQLPLLETTIDSTVEVLIKVNKYHLAQITAPQPLEIQPYEVKSIPITIQNIGSHTDTYNFNVTCSDKNIIVTPPPAITLRPGEISQALVGVAAPKTFSDVAGSATSIFVNAYSVDDPKTLFSNTVILTTSGIDLSSGSTYTAVLLVVVLFVIAALYIYISKKSKEKFCKKPEKPWVIPEEKEYLEKLKVENKKEYEQVMQMMREEYESSLLWYENYIKSIKEKERRKKQKTIKKEKESKVKKIKEKKSKAVEEKKIPLKKEKVEEPKAEEKVEHVDTESAEAEREKQKILLKIKREQEKQNKKFKF